LQTVRCHPERSEAEIQDDPRVMRPLRALSGA
jgi:hypothetical protein